MSGRDIKADAVRLGVPLYHLAAEAKINPHRLSRLLNDRDPLDSATATRITDALNRITEQPPEPAR